MRRDEKIFSKNAFDEQGHPAAIFRGFLSNGAFLKREVMRYYVLTPNALLIFDNEAGAAVNSMGTLVLGSCSSCRVWFLQHQQQQQQQQPNRLCARRLCLGQGVWPKYLDVEVRRCHEFLSRKCDGNVVAHCAPG